MRLKVWIVSALLGVGMVFSQVGLAVQQTACSCNCEKGNCSLDDFKSDQTVSAVLEVAADPTGLAVSPRQGQKESVEEVLKTYAKKHDCSLYFMSMQDLTQGLLKGFKLDESLTESQKSPQHETTQISKNQKFILISPDKYDCIKKLGFKLPVKALGPNAK